MLLFRKAAELRQFSDSQQNSGKSIGFVPTMGALHPGHLSLISASKSADDLTVCSIFVNPTQFNNPDDLKHYPVTIEKDIYELEKAGTDILFLPSVEEIYPPTWEKKHYDLGYLETILEGAFRPGHFQGVCQVVDRLLELVSPQQLYLGQKDFQQCMVIRRLLYLTGREELMELNVVPTLREKDGLAMSSRNMRLTPDERKQAVRIWEALNNIKLQYRSQPVEQVISEARSFLTGHGFDVDYVEIADGQTLLPASSPQPGSVALIAAALGRIRLIDNLILN